MRRGRSLAWGLWPCLPPRPRGRADLPGGHARALSALLNPTINSFERFEPDTLAPWLIDWGLDNRSAMERFVTDWEFRECAYHL